MLGAARRCLPHLMPPYIAQNDAGASRRAQRRPGGLADAMAPAREDTGGGACRAGARSWTSSRTASQRACRPFAPKRPTKAGRAALRSDRSQAGSRKRERQPGPRPSSTAFCPYCALPLQPAPDVEPALRALPPADHREAIEGRAVYLTEAAVPVFVAERRRVAASGRLTRERDRWLRLAAAAGAPAESQARLDRRAADGGRGGSCPDALPDHR